MNVDASTYGVIGDGVATDTAALQRAIDRCAESGGGTVTVPAGAYRIGTIFLRDDIRLHLESGCRIIASTDLDDYELSEVAVGDDIVLPWGVGLIRGQGVTGVSIVGDGVIDGQDTAFWTPRDDLSEHARAVQVHYRPTLPPPSRPHLLMFEDCRDVRIEGITLERSPIYGGWFVGCERISIRGVNLQHNFHGPNTDGLHFGSCRTVQITDSVFHTGDDCIAIDGIGPVPSEDFTISNCTFTSIDNVFRIYTGLCRMLDGRDCDGHVRGVTITDCVVHEAGGVINIAADRGTVEDISVSNLVVRQQLPGVTVCILADHGTVRNVQISHVQATTSGPITIAGRPDDLIADIRLTDLHFEVIPQPKKYGLDLPESLTLMTAYHHCPYYICLRGARDVSLHNVSVAWTDSEVDGTWPALRAVDLDRLTINGFHGRARDTDTESPAIETHRVRSPQILP